MVVDGLLGDVQEGGDVGVAQPVAEKPEHLELAGGEPRGIGGRRPPRLIATCL